jgi:uncharacterized membrane protein
MRPFFALLPLFFFFFSTWPLLLFEGERWSAYWFSGFSFFLFFKKLIYYTCGARFLLMGHVAPLEVFFSATGTGGVILVTGLGIGSWRIDNSSHAKY